MFQRIAVSVNEARSCATPSVYSIAYNIYPYTKVRKHGEIVLACTPIQQATVVSYALHPPIALRNSLMDVSYDHGIYRIDR